MKFLFTTTLVMLFNIVYSQTTITQFTFNSILPDANTGSGTLQPATGSGSISVIGGTVSSYVTGSTTDPATFGLDNSALNTTSYPAVNGADKTAGVQINVSTVDAYGIILSFDKRNSSAAANEVIIQYSIDGVNYIDFTTITTNTANVYASYAVNFSSVAALNNNANARFRIVSSFDGDPGSSYTGTTATYATSGTMQFDMVTLSSGGTLPIICRSFSGAILNNKAKLNWIASCSNMASYFEIQKSIDGLNFELQQTVNPKGLYENNYSVMDDNPYPGISFYRLKLINVDGKYSYSDIVKVKNATSLNASLTAYPNPVKSKLTLEWQWKKQQNGYIHIIDIMGKIVLKTNIAIREGLNRHDIKLPGLKPGSYIIQLLIGEEKFINSFTKD